MIARVLARVPNDVALKIEQLDQLGVPSDAIRTDAVEMLQAAGLRPGRTEILAAALKIRKQRLLR